jgi:hypothetical protein
MVFNKTSLAHFHWTTVFGKENQKFIFLKNDKSIKSIDNLTKSIDTKPNDKSQKTDQQKRSINQKTQSIYHFSLLDFV